MSIIVRNANHVCIDFDGKSIQFESAEHLEIKDISDKVTINTDIKNDNSLIKSEISDVKFKLEIENDSPTESLVIEGFSPRTETADIVKYFQGFGEIKSVHYLSTNNYLKTYVIKYYDHKGSENARKILRTGDLILDEHKLELI